MHNDTGSSGNKSRTDPLDELLQSAQWPEESSDRLDDLLRMAQWPNEAVQRRARRQGIWTRFAYASAAMLLLGLMLCSVLVLMSRSSPDVATPIASDATQQRSELRSNSVDRDSPSARHSLPDAATSRSTVARINPPDLSQAIAPGELRLRMHLARSVPRAATREDELIHQFLAHRLAVPDADLEKQIEPLLDRPRDIERRLLDSFSSHAGARESAAITLLSRIGSKDSVPLLLRLRLKQSTHEPAVRALLKLADAKTLSRVLRSETDPTLRKAITATLRARADHQTLLFVLATEGEL